ncbi:MAG: winged helix-turn-helix transcriptional regulator [Gammaproteobacteria bacterium]|nr:winged helix-turn-helix transcriptional regulator [Gammaproteobacteria bacterium]
MAKPFESLLGNSCELRMLEYLLPLDGIDFNITELGEEVGVSRVTASKIVTKFVEWGLLNPTRSVGITTYYTLNHESPIVKSVEQFNNTLIENILGNEMLYEIHEYMAVQAPQHLHLAAAGGDLLQNRVDPILCLPTPGELESTGVSSKSWPGGDALKQPSCFAASTVNTNNLVYGGI